MAARPSPVTGEAAWLLARRQAAETEAADGANKQPGGGLKCRRPTVLAPAARASVAPPGSLERRTAMLLSGLLLPSPRQRLDPKCAAASVRLGSRLLRVGRPSHRHRLHAARAIARSWTATDDGRRDRHGRAGFDSHVVIARACCPFPMERRRPSVPGALLDEASRDAAPRSRDLNQLHMSSRQRNIGLLFDHMSSPANTSGSSSSSASSSSNRPFPLTMRIENGWSKKELIITQRMTFWFTLAAYATGASHDVSHLRLTEPDSRPLLRSMEHSGGLSWVRDKSIKHCPGPSPSRFAGAPTVQWPSAPQVPTNSTYYPPYHPSGTQEKTQLNGQPRGTGNMPKQATRP